MFSKFVRHVGTNELHVGKIKFLVVKIDVGVGKNEIDVVNLTIPHCHNLLLLLLVAIKKLSEFFID